MQTLEMLSVLLQGGYFVKLLVNLYNFTLIMLTDDWLRIKIFYIVLCFKCITCKVCMFKSCPEVPLICGCLCLKMRTLSAITLH